MVVWFKWWFGWWCGLSGGLGGCEGVELSLSHYFRCYLPVTFASQFEDTTSHHTFTPTHAGRERTREGQTQHHKHHHVGV